MQGQWTEELGLTWDTPLPRLWRTPPASQQLHGGPSGCHLHKDSWSACGGRNRTIHCRFPLVECQYLDTPWNPLGPYLIRDTIFCEKQQQQNIFERNSVITKYSANAEQILLTRNIVVHGDWFEKYCLWKVLWPVSGADIQIEWAPC